MPSAHGVHDWIRGEAYRGRDADSYLDGYATIPAILSQNGWVCGHSGKWHLGSAHRPAEGFDFWYAHRTGDGNYFGAPVWQSGEAVAEKRYLTDAITQEAINFLDFETESGAPFYLEVNYTAPHTPWVNQHPEEYTKIYESCEFRTVPSIEAHPWFSWEPGPISEAMLDPSASLIGYFAALTAVDDGVGQLLDHLERNKLIESTCIVFTSDNGFSCGHHGIWGKGNATWPLNVWEESVRVPFVMSMPGTFPQGAKRTDLAGACDLLPTLLDLVGVPLPRDPLIAGSSLLPLLDGRRIAREESVFVFDEYGGTRMIRNTRWKYVIRAGSGPEELYDLQLDPDEVKNVAQSDELEAMHIELRDQLQRWFEAHTLPKLDAFEQPVSGRGQVSPILPGKSAADRYETGEGEVRLGNNESLSK